jgi:phospholipase C
VAPPWGAVPPDDLTGEYDFDFTRFGPRVPAVLVSPLIKAGTVYRAPAGSTPFDHTSILKTIENRWGLPPLTARDAAAPDVTGALTLGTARDDDPLAGVVVPVSGRVAPEATRLSHIERVQRTLLLARERPGALTAPISPRQLRAALLSESRNDAP